MLGKSTNPGALRVDVITVLLGSYAPESLGRVAQLAFFCLLCLVGHSTVPLASRFSHPIGMHVHHTACVRCQENLGIVRDLDARAEPHRVISSMLLEDAPVHVPRKCGNSQL